MAFEVARRAAALLHGDDGVVRGVNGEDMFKLLGDDNDAGP